MSQIQKPLNKEDGTVLFFSKSFGNHCLNYIVKIILTYACAYHTKKFDNIILLKGKHSFSKFFFPFSDYRMQQVLNETILKIQKFFYLQENSFLKLIYFSNSSALSCHILKRVNLLARLKLGLIYLHKHKFKDSFQDSRFRYIEKSAQFPLHCPIHLNEV